MIVQYIMYNHVVIEGKNNNKLLYFQPLFSVSPLQLDFHFQHELVQWLQYPYTCCNSGRSVPEMENIKIHDYSK